MISLVSINLRVDANETTNMCTVLQKHLWYLLSLCIEYFRIFHCNTKLLLLDSFNKNFYSTFTINKNLITNQIIKYVQYIFSSIYKLWKCICKLINPLIYCYMWYSIYHTCTLINKKKFNVLILITMYCNMLVWTKYGKTIG